MISSLFGIVHFLKNFDPKSFAQNLISNLFTSIINKLPGNILKNISDNIFNGSSLSNIIGSVLGGGGVGNPVSAIVNAVFGRCASTASMKPINTLCGGFECPDAISLTEKHIRKKEEKKIMGSKDFIEYLKPYAQAMESKYGIDWRIIVAQAALESGWGEYGRQYNLWGMRYEGPAGKIVQDMLYLMTSGKQ
jgi:hypothetical protein